MPHLVGGRAAALLSLQLQLIAVPSAGGAATIAVDATKPTHEVNKLYMGCHSDSGFGHQVRSFYSNLLSGESFEPEPSVTWGQTLLPPSADANVTLEGKGAGMHGQTALRLSYRSGSGLVGLGNRGFRNEGLSLEASRPYEGFLFVQANSSGALQVSLVNTTNCTRPFPLGCALTPMALCYSARTPTRRASRERCSRRNRCASRAPAAGCG